MFLLFFKLKSNSIEFSLPYRALNIINNFSIKFHPYSLLVAGIKTHINSYSTRSIFIPVLYSVREMSFIFHDKRFLVLFHYFFSLLFFLLLGFFFIWKIIIIFVKNIVHLYLFLSNTGSMQWKIRWYATESSLKLIPNQKYTHTHIYIVRESGLFEYPRNTWQSFVKWKKKYVEFSKERKIL